jgi:hypothetical protein
MSIDATTIEKLTASLIDGDKRPMGDDERKLLIATIETVGSDQATIVQLQRLLAARGESLERIDAITASALTSARARLNQPDADLEYDYAAADLARQSLAAAVNDAKSGKAAISAALQFVRDFVVLAG